MKRILVLGDSLSDGLTLPRREAYPALLAQKLREAGLRNFEVINESVSGGTTAGGLARVTKHLERRIDILVLQLGINDAFQGRPLSNIRSNLQNIVDRVRKDSPEARIIVVGMQLPNYAAEDYVRSFGEMYAELAQRNDAALVPYLLAGVGGNPLLNLPDRIHPNGAGQKILAENVWKVLEPVAREVAARP